ncbi:unnamed protein product [Choristocarpus tenellus]
MLPEGSSIKVQEGRDVPMILLLGTMNETASLAFNKDIVVDTLPSHVLYVTSSKLNAEYGAGEEIPVSVTFSAPVVFFSSVSLFLDTGPDTVYAECPYVSGNNSEVVTFLYTVAEGDQSYDLHVYEGGQGDEEGTGGGLVGVALRDASTPIQAVDTSLPSYGKDGSLDVNKDIIIDTTTPYVLAVVPLRQGVCTVGQEVDLQVIYNKPVNVTGTPRLEIFLNSFNTSNATYAYYDKSFDTTSFTQGDSALSFVYTVQDGDEVIYLKHTSSDALELVHNSTIKRASTNPTTDALISLPPPGAGSLSESVTKAEVVIRGLYHAQASDLELTLIHQEHSCTLTSATDTSLSSPSQSAKSGVISSRSVLLGVPPYRRMMDGFGPDPGAATGAMSQPSFHHRGMGYDYAFSDTVGENLAIHEQAVTRQSSTLFNGVSTNAVDGGLSRFFSGRSTSLTDYEVNPWWQVTLASPHTLGYMRIFGRAGEISQREIQVVTLRSKTELAGSFTLTVTDSLGNSRTTDEIYYNAVGALSEERGSDSGTGVGESMESKLEALSIVDSVEVARSSLLSTNVYQHTWTVTFISPAGDIPAIKLGSDEGLSSYSNEFIFMTLEDGTAAGGIYWGGVTHNFNDAHAPGWVMVFNSSSNIDSSMSLEEAKGNAIFTRHLAHNDEEINLHMPDGLVGQVVRIQLESTGYLSLSEVQLYELQFPTLSMHSGMSPIPSQNEWNPIQAEESLTAAFSGTVSRGQWVLRLRDTVLKESHEEGGVAGWELAITDIFGNVARHTYSSVATIEALPKYGQLFSGNNGDTFEISAALGYERHLGPCYGYSKQEGIEDLKRVCPTGFSSAPSLSTRTLGAVAARNRINVLARAGVPSVWYLPEKGYLGPDDFSFSVIAGGVRSTEATVVELHTRSRCRLVEEGEGPKLCSCGSQIVQSNKAQQTICYNAIADACASENGVAQDNTTGSNTRITSRIQVRMCKSCSVTYQARLTTVPTSYSELTSECLREVDKVGNWLVAKGYCGEEGDKAGMAYSFPLCQNEAFDQTPPIDGPRLGSSMRTYQLDSEGDLRTSKTDFRPQRGPCRCTQQPKHCACRDNAWANRE